MLFIYRHANEFYVKKNEFCILIQKDFAIPLKLEVIKERHCGMKFFKVALFDSIEFHHTQNDMRCALLPGPFDDTSNAYLHAATSENWDEADSGMKWSGSIKVTKAMSHRP